MLRRAPGTTRAGGACRGSGRKSLFGRGGRSSVSVTPVGGAEDPSGGAVEATTGRRSDDSDYSVTHRLAEAARSGRLGGGLHRFSSHRTPKGRDFYVGAPEGLEVGARELQAAERLRVA